MKVVAGVLSTGADLLIRPLPSPITVTPQDYAEAPLPYAFARPRERTYVIPEGSRDVLEFNLELTKGYDLLYDSPNHASELLVAAKPIANAIASASPDALVNAGEQQVAKKLSFQRRPPPRYFVGNHDPGPSQPSDLFKECMDIYISHVAKGVGESFSLAPLLLMAMDSDPSNTNQGFPTFSSSPPSRLIAARALGLRDYTTASDFIRISRELSIECGFEDWLVWPVAMSKRLGPMVKPQPLWEDDVAGLGAIATQETAGYFCRARKIYMTPFLLNMMISPLTVLMKKGRLAMLGNNHSAEGQAQYLDMFKKEDEGWHVGESDLNAYDTTISPEMRGILWAALEKHGFNKTAIDILRWLDGHSTIVMPPWNSRMDGSMAIYQGRTGLLSGLKVTTELGSAIVSALTMEAFIEQGFTTIDECRAKMPFFLCLGDDVLTLTEKKIDPDIYTKTFAREGMSVEFFEGRRFLMQHVKGGNTYAVATRIIQQTMFNEDAYTHPGQIAIGLASRLDRPILPEHQDELRKWMRLMETTRMGTMFQELRTIPFSAIPKLLLSRQDTKDFIRSSAGKQWLVALSYKAEWQGTARMTMEMLAGYGLTADDTSERAFRAALMRNMFGQDQSSIRLARRELSRMIWI